MTDEIHNIQQQGVDTPVDERLNDIVIDSNVWKNALTIMCVSESERNGVRNCSNSVSGVKIQNDGSISDTLRGRIQNHADLQTLKKQMFFQKPILFYDCAENNVVYASIHLLYFKNWTISTSVWNFEFIANYDTRITYDTFLFHICSHVSDYNNANLCNNSEPIIEVQRVMLMCKYIHTYNRAFVQYQNNLLLKDGLQNVHNRIQCYRADYITKHNQIVGTVDDLTETMNELMDDCDARFAGLFTSIEIFKKGVAFTDHDLSCVHHKVNEMVDSIRYHSKLLIHEKTERTKCKTRQESEIQQLHVCVSSLKRKQCALEKEVQNEKKTKWMMSYFMWMSAIVYFFVQPLLY